MVLCRAGLGGVLVLSAEAGLSPRQATHFSLLRQRKVSKRKATPSLRPLRFAKGQTCGGGGGGGGGGGARWPPRGPPPTTPPPPRRRRSQQGRDSRTSKHPHGPLLRSAACAQRVAFAPARWGRAQRSEA